MSKIRYFVSYTERGWLRDRWGWEFIDSEIPPATPTFIRNVERKLREGLRTGHPAQPGPPPSPAVPSRRFVGTISIVSITSLVDLTATMKAMEREQRQKARAAKKKGKKDAQATADSSSSV